jgi:hypothetical protein
VIHSNKGGSRPQRELGNALLPLVVRDRLIKNFPVWQTTDSIEKPFAVIMRLFQVPAAHGFSARFVETHDLRAQGSRSVLSRDKRAWTPRRCVNTLLWRPYPPAGSL